MKERTTRGGPSFNEFRRCVVVRVVGVVACRSQREAKKGQNFQNKIGDASLTVIGRLNQFFQFLG